MSRHLLSFRVDSRYLRGTTSSAEYSETEVPDAQLSGAVNKVVQLMDGTSRRMF